MAATRVPRVVPWASTAEYMGVADGLYAASVDERRRGVALVKAWRARGRVPAAIDATANLVEMAVADQERRPGVTPGRLRHMYAMALIRFVNGIVDLEQRGTYAQPMAALAARIGMPAWFVELRHACTHEQIPSLAVLRSTCDQALRWLGDCYWRRQARALPADTMRRVRSAIDAHVTMCAARAGGAGDGAPSARAAAPVRKALRLLLAELHPDAVRLHVVPVLIEPGFLVPAAKRLRARFPDCRLPPDLAARWAATLGLLADAWGPALVFEELLAGIAAALAPGASEHGVFEPADAPAALGTSQAATLVAWVRWILERHYAAAEAPISIDGLLEACLRNPCYYSRAVLRVVSQVDPALGRELRPFVDYMGKALAALVALDADAAATAAAAAPRRPPRVAEDALRDEEALMARRLEDALGPARPLAPMDVDPEAPPAAPMAAGAATPARWAYAEQPAWSPCPIGTLCDGSIPPLEWPLWLDDVPLR